MDMTEIRWVEIPDAPAIPGLRFRFYDGEEDIPALVEVANRFNAAVGETERWSVEMMASLLRNRPHVPESDLRIFLY